MFSIKRTLIPLNGLFKDERPIVSVIHDVYFTAKTVDLLVLGFHGSKNNLFVPGRFGGVTGFFVFYTCFSSISSSSRHQTDQVYLFL